MSTFFKTLVLVLNLWTPLDTNSLNLRTFFKHLFLLKLFWLLHISIIFYFNTYSFFIAFFQVMISISLKWQKYFTLLKEAKILPKNSNWKVPFTLGEEFMVWAKSHQGKVYHSVQVYLPLQLRSNGTDNKLQITKFTSIYQPRVAVYLRHKLNTRSSHRVEQKI